MEAVPRSRVRGDVTLEALGPLGGPDLHGGGRPVDEAVVDGVLGEGRDDGVPVGEVVAVPVELVHVHGPAPARRRAASRTPASHTNPFSQGCEAAPTSSRASESLAAQARRWRAAPASAPRAACSRDPLPRPEVPVRGEGGCGVPLGAVHGGGSREVDRDRRSCRRGAVAAVPEGVQVPRQDRGLQRPREAGVHSPGGLSAAPHVLVVARTHVRPAAAPAARAARTDPDAALSAWSTRRRSSRPTRAVHPAPSARRATAHLCRNAASRSAASSGTSSAVHRSIAIRPSQRARTAAAASSAVSSSTISEAGGGGVVREAEARRRAGGGARGREEAGEEQRAGDGAAGAGHAGAVRDHGADGAREGRAREGGGAERSGPARARTGASAAVMSVGCVSKNGEGRDRGERSFVLS